MITFGLAQARERKEEKYDFPVLTMGIDKGEKTARKFYFNKAAIEQLGLTDTSTVCFARTDDGIAIVNCSNLGEDLVPERIRRDIKKTDMSISAKPDYDKITKHFELDTSDVHEFKIDIKSELVNEETPAGDLVLLVEEEGDVNAAEAEASVERDEVSPEPENNDIDWTRPTI